MARKNTINKKVCTKCGKELSIDNFYRDKSQKTGFASWCKSCERTYNKAYFASLKKVNVARKIDIGNDEKALAVFEKGMRNERVNRAHEKARVNVKRDTKARANKARAKVKK